MGKKRIIKKSEKEILAEKEKIDQALKKRAEVVVEKKIKQGRIYISASYNNTLFSLTDSSGNVLAWVSAGSLGFKGAKKATPWAASKVAEIITQKARKLGIETVRIFVKGIGSSRESSLRSLANQGLNIISIKDITPIPHNGCRPRRARRV